MITTNPTKEYKLLGKMLEPLDFFDPSDFKSRQIHIEELLCRYLNMKTVVAFIGAGTSYPLNYPLWGTFAEDIFFLLKITLEDKNVLSNLISEESNDRAAKVKETASSIYRRNRKKCKKLFLDQKYKYFERFLKILSKLIFDNLGKDEIDETQKLYNQKKADFEKLLNYIKQPKDNELDALAVFSECERLLCSSTDENFSCSRKNWAERKQSKFFRLLVQCYFKIKRVLANLEIQPNITDENFNPYIALLKLPIKKFITFNYDLEIERALLYKNRIAHNHKIEELYGDQIKCDKIIQLCGEKSFAQKTDFSKELANFSVARYEGVFHSVFHCHGRVDDIESSVVSEEDYQKWYLREDGNQFLPFRQTLDLALDSNPILFIGFGLKDADMMRLLRTITANRSTEKTRNPLFCLLFVAPDAIEEEWTGKKRKSYKWKNREELEDECTALYMKYGLHVIPVFAGNYEWEKGDPTCQKLLELHGRWREWWEGIVKKPKFRSFDFEPHDQFYYHYKFETENKETNENMIAGFDLDFHEKLAEALNFKKKRNRSGKSEQVSPTEDDKHPSFTRDLAIVVGDGGTGKSWSVQSFLKQKQNKRNKQKKIFYWSSYYANDVLTGIDRLIRFFKTPEELEKNPENTKFEWLKQIVDNEKDSIIVFDGIEKLLKPNKDNTEGESVSPEVREFFKIISHENVESKIILTTRLFPTDIFYNIDEKLLNVKDPKQKEIFQNLKADIKKEQILQAPKCWLQHLRDDTDFDILGKEKETIISTVCSLFEGHIFGISLLKGILRNSSDYEKEIKPIIRNVVNTPIEKRINRIIREAIKDTDRNRFTAFKRPAKEFIQRIALFMHPIREEIAKVCFDEIIKQDEKLAELEKIESDQIFFDLLTELVNRSLVQEVTIREKSESKGKYKERIDYVVHPLVRNYVFERLHESRFNSYPSLQLPGFSSGKEVVDPGSKIGKKVSTELFVALCEKARAQEIPLMDKDLERKKIDSDMCRGAFSILRSRFCSNTVSRWGNYTEYTKMTLLLYDTSKEVSSQFWDYIEPTQSGFENCCVKDVPAPLYPDELAWVYNEVGLASQSMGNNLNATALWEQGFEISKLIDRDREGRYLFQSNINLGAIYIYYGKLNVAKDYLTKAFEIANKLENKKLSARAAGYIALVKYLRGNLEEANIDFDKACVDLSENPRGRAVFMNFHGELLLKLNDLKTAHDKIEQSQHIAESEYYPDLIAYARLSKANYFSQCNELVKAQNEYQFALKYSREKHLRRLEAATLSGMSRLAEKLGDFSTAIRLAVDSLKVSNEYLLSLHQTQGLIVLGKALLNGHYHRDLGIACLKTARELAQKQEYFLRMNEAQEELAKHNESY